MIIFKSYLKLPEGMEKDGKIWDFMVDVSIVIYWYDIYQWLMKAQLLTSDDDLRVNLLKKMCQTHGFPRGKWSAKPCGPTYLAPFVTDCSIVSIKKW
jgi:hypothetical protein